MELYLTGTAAGVKKKTDKIRLMPAFPPDKA
jgi:hypothetical protein